MRICQSQGILHPDHLFEVLTPRQLDDWLAFYDVEPWGGPVEDFRTGIEAWSNVMPHAGKRALTIEQFTPQWSKPEPLTPEELKAKARRILSAAAPRK